MGFKISWIGFEGVDRPACLERLGMIDTGQADEAMEAPFSLAISPTGWSILFVNDFGYATDARLAELSQGGRLIGCRIHEGLMYSSAACFVDGVKTWSVVHNAQESARHIEAGGDLPATFEALRQRLVKRQDEEDANEAEVDHIFDCPLELAREFAGYRHDGWDDEGDALEFFEVRAPGGQPQSWWAKLFGKRV